MEPRSVLVGMPTDASLIEAASLAGVARVAAVATWVLIVEDAAALDNDGSFAITARRIAAYLAEPVETIEAVLEAFEAIGLTAHGYIAIDTSTTERRRQ
jgi:hypothetical protein